MIIKCNTNLITIAYIASRFLNGVVNASRCPFHKISETLTSSDSYIPYRALSESTINQLQRASKPETFSNTIGSSWITFPFLSLISLFEKLTFEDKLSENITDKWSFSRLIKLESNWTEEQPWHGKITKIWNEIKSSPPIANHYPSLSEFVFRLILLGDDFTRLSLPVTFRPYSNTQKVLHSASSYGRVLFRWTDESFRKYYTGLFSEPQIEAIMSGSAGNPYVGNQSAAFGFGFKFFRTNVQPATILTLNAFLGKGAYWNIFGYMSCNHVSLAEMAVLFPTLVGWSKFPNQNGISNLARFNTNGTEFSQPVFPYSLCFVPNSVLTQRIGSPRTLSSLSSLHSQLALVQPGERLFDIVAIFHPKVLNEPKLLRNPNYARRVGNVIAVTRFRKSQFGDSRLFFQHQPFDDDLLLRPDWLPYMTLQNLIREGAFGNNRIFYAPPRPLVHDQILALRSLARFLVRTFTIPFSNGWHELGISGHPSFRELLQYYLLQGGPTTTRIILNKTFPLSTFPINGFDSTLQQGQPNRNVGAKSMNNRLKSDKTQENDQQGDGSNRENPHKDKIYYPNEIFQVDAVNETLAALQREKLHEWLSHALNNLKTTTATVTDDIQLNQPLVPSSKEKEQVIPKQRSSESETEHFRNFSFSDAVAKTVVINTDPLGFGKRENHHLTQNLWPSTIPDSLSNEDTFLQAWQQSILLSKYLTQFYILRGKPDEMNWLEKSFGVPVNLNLNSTWFLSTSWLPQPPWLNHRIVSDWFLKASESVPDIRNGRANLGTMTSIFSNPVLLGAFLHTVNSFYKDVVKKTSPKQQFEKLRLYENVTTFLESPKPHSISKKVKGDSSLFEGEFIQFSEKIPKNNKTIMKPLNKSELLVNTTYTASDLPLTTTSNPGISLNHLRRLRDRAIVELLRDISLILTSPFGAPLTNRFYEHFDPKLAVIHLVEPVFYSTIRQSEGRDDLFKGLISFILGMKFS